MHQGTHEPLISKSLFDRAQQVMQERTKIMTKGKKSFPYLGLATCSNCGSAITAERQKGHHYYHCTRKNRNVPCREPFVREEVLENQINQIIQSVALPQLGFAQLSTWLKQEARASSYFEARRRKSRPRSARSRTGCARRIMAAEKTKLQSELKNITQKLDRLLDAHLDGAIEKAEYLSRKERFLHEKIQIEEKITKLNTEAMPWLEPCANFLKATSQAHLLAASQNHGAKKQFLKKVGSNLRLSARTLACALPDPWPLMAQFNHDFNHLNLPSGAAKEKRPAVRGAEKFPDHVQLEELWS